MEATEILEALEVSAQAAERVLLKVEQLALLVGADKSRRLIELAHSELTEAVEKADALWEAHGGGFAEVASSSGAPGVRRAWQEFRALLANCAGAAAKAAAAVAAQLAVAEEALEALGLCREYGPEGALRLSGGAKASRVLT